MSPRNFLREDPPGHGDGFVTAKAFGPSWSLPQGDGLRLRDVAFHDDPGAVREDLRHRPPDLG